MTGLLGAEGDESFSFNYLTRKKMSTFSICYYIHESFNLSDASSLYYMLLDTILV